MCGQDLDVECLAVINDTVGALMSCAHTDRQCAVGIILGRYLLPPSHPTTHTCLPTTLVYPQHTCSPTAHTCLPTTHTCLSTTHTCLQPCVGSSQGMLLAGPSFHHCVLVGTSQWHIHHKMDMTWLSVTVIVLIMLPVIAIPLIMLPAAAIPLIMLPVAVIPVCCQWRQCH